MRVSYFFWAELCLRIAKKSDLRSPHALVDVWTNLVLIKATNPVEAVNKAVALGKRTASVSSFGLEWDGEPADMEFLGISSMGVIHGPLEDGEEINWGTRRCRLRNAARDVTPLNVIKNQVAKEFKTIASSQTKQGPKRTKTGAGH